MFKSRPHPDVVVLNSHFEVVIFALFKLLLPREKRPDTVYLGFIYTPRSRPWMQRLRQSYFEMVFRMADQIICHSKNERDLYGKIFKNAKDKFCYMPYGMYVTGEECHRVNASAIQKIDPPRIFSAGRSGRDYSTLTKAVAATGISTHIVCDRRAPMEGIEIPPEVSVLTNCYGKDYLKELEKASIVVIPLLVDDISAGQMVLIQAMAYRKPIIITRTITVQEYIQHERECLLVERSDAAGLQQAIGRLLNDSELATRLANSARQAYERHFSMRAYAVNLVAAAQRRNRSRSRSCHSSGLK